MLLVRRFKETPSAVLLLAQLAAIVGYPFLDGDPLGRSVFGVFGLVVLALAVLAVRTTPALTWVSLTIGLPTVVLTVLEGVRPEPGIVLASAVLHAAFYAYTVYALIKYMFHDREVTRDELWATGATFTVLVWAYAYVFTAVQVIWPGSFSATLDPGADRSWVELMHMSVATLTGVGLSDVVPVRPHAQGFMSLAQISGMLYIALVIARLVAIIAARAARRAV